MVNPKKYRNRYTTNIPFEKENYERLNKYLPKNVCIADEINKFVDERGLQLEQEANKEKNNNINNDNNGIKKKGYNTTLDEFFKLNKNENLRFKSMYEMNKDELIEYGKFIDNHLTEISSIMWIKHKVTSFLGRKVNLEMAMNCREIAYGNTTTSI